MTISSTPTKTCNVATMCAGVAVQPASSGINERAQPATVAFDAQV